MKTLYKLSLLNYRAYVSETTQKKVLRERDQKKTQKEIKIPNYHLEVER